MAFINGRVFGRGMTGRAYRAPIAISLVLVGFVLTAIGAGVLFFPGYDKFLLDCFEGYGIYPGLCTVGQYQMAEGVVLGLTGLTLLVFAVFWYARGQPAQSSSASGSPSPEPSGNPPHGMD
jgi:hypothetical protein